MERDKLLNYILRATQVPRKASKSVLANRIGATTRPNPSPSTAFTPKYSRARIPQDHHAHARPLPTQPQCLFSIIAFSVVVVYAGTF
jgi:hypothetical protein